MDNRGYRKNLDRLPKDPHNREQFIGRNYDRVELEKELKAQGVLNKNDKSYYNKQQLTKMYSDFLLQQDSKYERQQESFAVDQINQMDNITQNMIQPGMNQISYQYSQSSDIIKPKEEKKIQNMDDLELQRSQLFDQLTSQFDESAFSQTFGQQDYLDQTIQDIQNIQSINQQIIQGLQEEGKESPRMNLSDISMPSSVQPEDRNQILQQEIKVNKKDLQQKQIIQQQQSDHGLKIQKAINNTKNKLVQKVDKKKVKKLNKVQKDVIVKQNNPLMKTDTKTGLKYLQVCSH